MWDVRKEKKDVGSVCVYRLPPLLDVDFFAANPPLKLAVCCSAGACVGIADGAPNAAGCEAPNAGCCCGAPKPPLDGPPKLLLDGAPKEEEDGPPIPNED